MKVSELVNNREQVVNKFILDLEIRPDNFLLKLSSSKVPDKFYIIEKYATLRGIRLGEHRIDAADILYVGPELDINDIKVKIMLKHDLPLVAALNSTIDGDELLDKMQRMQFVNKIGGGKYAAKTNMG